MLVRSEVTAGRVGAMYLLHGHFVLCWLCFLSYVNFYAVRVLAQQPRLSSCLEIKLNEQFPTFDIVLAQNVTDDRNGGVLVAHMADKLFRLASRVERSQELNGSVAVAVIEASYFGDADGMWQYKNSTDAVWTAFPIGLSDSNALLITRRGFIRFVPNADYFNFPVRDMPSPRLVFHGWNGFGSNNNISDVAIENCVFSRFTVKTFVTVLRLNFVRAVEITPFSMKLEVNVQLTDNITNGAIQYKLKSFGICGAWSVTERVEDALASAIGGVFTHEIHLLQPSTEYTPQIVFPAASDTSDGFPVMTAPDVVQNVEVKGVTNSSDVIISWEPFQSEVLLMYIVVIDGREGMFIPMQRPRQLRQSLSPFGFDDGFSVFDTETVTLNALKSSSIYEVRVAAADGSRDFSPAPGPFSPPVLFETNVTRRPGPPGYVKLYQACCHTLAVQWEFPFEPEGPITEFVVELFEDDQPSFSSSQFSTSVTERSHVFTSVFGGDFYATVRARNSRGLGENATSPTVTLTAPAPAPRLGVPFEFTVENVTDVSAIVVITFELRPEGPPPLFNVLLYPNDDCRKGDPNNSTNVSSRVYSAIGLHPFTAYSVCVWESKRPLNTSVIGFFITDQSTPTGRTTVQDVSHVMSVVARTDSVLLRWTPVDKPNGVIGYEVIVEQLEGLSIERPSLLLDPNLLPPPGQDNPYYQWRVTGLEAGVGYNFTVQPYNLKYNTTGDGTSIVVFTFIGRPGPPSISLRTNATDTSVTVRWDPPAKKNGEILSYGITLVVDDVNSTSGCLMHREQQFVSVSPQQGGLLEYTFTSLMPNTSYVTTIRAKTAAGYGEMSPPFGVVTLPLVSAPTPGGPCLVAGCSDFSTCVLQSSDVIQCSCNEGFIGDGYRCVDLPVLVVRKRSESEIHISFRDLRRGDIRLLNNTVVKFQLFTPDNQLVRSDQRPFQLKINESTRLEVARVVFRELQPGVKYNLSYSFPIGSIVHTKTAMVTTQSSVPQAPPMDIIIAVVTNISATLSWRPPPRAFNNGPLTGYDVMASNLFTINGLFVSLRRKTASNMTSVKIDGLLPFNKYEVRVAAHTSAGRGPWSDSKHFTTKSATPGPPRIDDAFDVFNGSNPVVYMSWRYPAVPGGEITHFLIHEFIGEGDPLEELGSPSSVGPAENVFLLEDLGRNWRVPQRQVRVQAGSNSSLGILAAEDVPRSPRQFFDPESASVTNITQSESGNFSVTVSWPPVNITDFLLLHGIPPGALIEYQVFPLRGARNCKDPPPNVPLILNINITSAVLPDLFSNSIYSVCVRVRAFRELTSVVARTFVITPQSVPGPVVNLSSQSVSSESAELTWLPPVSPNGVIGYRVQVKEINGSHAFSVLMQPSSLVTSDEDTTVGLLLSGLNGNRTYSLSVMAYNLKSGRNGQPVSIDLKTMLGTPHPPENVTAISAGPDSITILWFPSVSDGVVGYQISSVMANATDENLLPVYFVSYRVKSVSAATLQDTIDGLEPNTKYALWVKTMGLETTSQPSEVVFQRTEVLVTTPEPVSSQPPTPSSQCLSARCSKNATCVPQSSGLPRCDCVTGFAGDGYICVELPRFKRNASTSDIHILLTIQYGDFQMLNDTDVMFRLFTPDPDGQLVQRQQSPFQFIVDVISGIPSEIRNQVSFEELQPGVNYTLKYSFSIGSFKHSNTVKAATLPSVPLAPPTDVRITEITNSSATVSWQRPPRAFNSGPLTGYDVNVRSLFAINGSVVNITKTTGDVTSVQINDLFPFQKHVVSVAAHTSAGRGPWSDGRQFTTKSATPGPPRIDDAFDVFNGSNAVVYTSWRYPAVPGGEITHFLIHALIGEGDTPGELGSPSSVGAAENFFLLENLGRNREFLPPLQVGVQAGSNSSLGILAAKDVLQPGQVQPTSGQVQPTPGESFLEFSNGVSPSGLPKSASVTNRTQSESGNFTVTVSWPAVNITDFLSLHELPQNANIEYQVFHFRGAGECAHGAHLSNVPLNISSTSVVLPDLLPNSIYSICVMIVYEEFEFISVVAITFVRTPQSVPGPVVNLSSQSISSESAELTWLPPLSPNGVIGYRVQVKEINGRNLPPILMQPSSLITSDGYTTVGLLLSDLNGNRTYSLSVMAYNLESDRDGQPMSLELKTKLGTPRPPENVTATSDGPDAITVHWFPSVSDGVVKYQITVVMANATENKLPDYFVSPHVEEVSATTTTYTVSDLKPNTKYAAFMKAMGLEAASQPSEVVFQETKDVTRLSICGVRCILSEARGITFREFTIQLGQEIANSTAQLIKNDSLEPDELRTVNSILESLVDLQERALSAGILLTPSDTYIDTFIELSSIILDLQQEDSWHALNSSEGAPLFLNTLERYSRIIAASYSFSDGSSSKNFSSDNLVLTVNNITKSTVRSISFPSGRLSHFSSSSQGNMVISASLLSQLLQQPNVTRLLVSNMIFQNLQQYMPSSTSGESLSVGEQRKSSSELPSTVLVSASIVEDVVGQSYNPNYTTRTLPESVTIAYSNIEPNSSANYTCSFWQFETNSSPGQWSSSGVTTKQLNDTNVLCTSTHLTSFSVLVSVKSSVSSDTLTYITYIGCGISLLSLLITLVVLVAFRSYLLFERNFININFVVALMLALIFFLAGIDQSSNREVCKAMTVILHYFFLAVFCWMLCEGYLLYLLLVVVFDSGRSHAKRYFAFGWGLPLLIVGISLGVRYDEYGAYDYCFLTHHKGLIWAFVGPMAAILLVNLAVFIKAVKIVVSKANRSVNKDKLHVVKSGLKAMGVFLPVLGLTWGIGVFAIDTLSLPLAYVFTVLNSLQGLFVFIFHCLLNRQLRKAITTIRQKREQTKLMEKSIGTSSTGTGTASQPKARRRRSHKYEVAAVTDESTVEMQHVELHQFTQKDMDNLESFDTQVTTLKVETSIGYGNSMTSVRSDEPLKKSSDSSSGKDSQDSSPEFSPKSGQFRDNDGSQEEQLYNRDEGRPIQAIIPEQTLIPLSSSDSQSHYPAENALPLIKSLLNDGSRSSIDTVQSVSAADCMVIPRGASHAVIIQQGNNDRISDAQDLSTSERGSRDRFPSTNSDSNSADVRQERFI